ncbi:MAG: DNA cytosine methyltransferase [Candidatus Hodarchaeales archaeon]
MRIISLFSGAGGMDLGFYAVGYDIVFANDIFKEACLTYRSNFEHEVIQGDISSISVDNIPDADIVIGGFPCQDFSMLGKRWGIHVKRGRLYKELVKIIAHKEPKVFIAENVKGILSANDGKAIALIVNDLSNPAEATNDDYSFDFVEEAVYMYKEGISCPNNRYTVSIHKVNFADYGVPQTRERVLIIGIRNDLGKKFVFPEPIYFKGNYVSSGEAFTGKAIYFKEVGLVSHNNELPKVSDKVKKMLRAIPEGGNFKHLPEHLKIKGVMSNIYRKLDRNEPAYTVIANGGGGTHGYHYEEPRPLTNRERARLQTFPDDFVFFGSRNKVRMQIGNAVPPLGILPVAVEIKKQIFDIDDDLNSKYLDFLRSLRNSDFEGFWTMSNIKEMREVQK